jgi:coenzyme F420-0:L-glutamate ligase/coenzyme F420-1:gamma-L-glutamate ligase
MSNSSGLSIIPIQNFPLLETPCELGPLVVEALKKNNLSPQSGDVLVVAHKIISKAEGAVVDLDQVKPSANAIELAKRTDKDPALVEVILQQSKKIVREVHGVLICENHLGLICANAGVDRSNAGAHQAVMLPQDPDHSARQLHQALHQAFDVNLPILVADTHGRPWREGAVGICIGIAGMDPFLDYRGTQDLYDYEMQTEIECVADELCAAATLVMGQGNEGVPLALIRGLKVTHQESSSELLLRDPNRDLFR